MIAQLYRHLAIQKKLEHQLSLGIVIVLLWYIWDAVQGQFTLLSYAAGLSVIMLRAYWHHRQSTAPWGYAKTQFLFYFMHTLLHAIAWGVSFLIEQRSI